MKRWLVQSGNMERTVRAADEAIAVQTALRAEMCSDDPADLGRIASVIEITSDAEMAYVAIETALKEIGHPLRS